MPASSSAQNHFERGVKLGLEGEYPFAIEEFLYATQEEPEFVEAYISLGVAYHRLCIERQG